MALNVVEIENLLVQESQLDLYATSTLANIPPSNTHHQFQALKSQFLSKLQQAEFLKLISGFSPQFVTQDQVQDLQTKVSTSKSQTKQARELIREKQRDVELLGKEICDSLDQLLNEKQQLITNIGKAREAEEEYSRIISQVHPDQVFVFNKAIVEELLLKEDDEKKELRELELLVKEKMMALTEKQSKLGQETIKVQELGTQKADAEVREAQAIKLSKTKDPQVEELGKWYKETILLLHTLNDIEKMTVHSDTKLEIQYAGDPAITAVYELFPDQKQMIDVHLNVNINIGDILSQDFFTVSAALSFTITQTRLRIQAYQQRIQEMNTLIQKGFIYDEEQLELLIQSENGRAFVFKLDPCYPFGGLESVLVLGVEPDEGFKSLLGGDVLKWNQKLKTMSGSRISDIISFLE